MSWWTSFEKPAVEVEPLGQTFTEKFVWKIPNFTQVIQSDESIQQQELRFMAGKFYGLPCKWRFVLRPMTDSHFGKWIGVFLEMVQLPGGVMATEVEFHVKVKNLAGGVATSTFKTGNKSLGYRNVEKGIYPSCGFSYVLCLQTTPMPVQPDGCLNMEFLFRMNAPQHDQCDLATHVQMFTLISKDQLYADLGNEQVLIGRGGNPETKVVCKDGTEFLVNRAWLMTRSPVFHQMFATARMTEAQTGVVKIEDIPPKAMEVLLYYIHTGRLHTDWSKPEVVPGLLYAADKYQLELLREFLGNVVAEVCTVENVVKLLRLTNRLNMHNAEKKVLKFYKDSLKSSKDVKAQEEEDDLFGAPPGKIPKLMEYLSNFSRYFKK